MKIYSYTLLGFAFFAFGCWDDVIEQYPHPCAVSPFEISGGGFDGLPIDGCINIHVIDEDTQTAIPNANVQVIAPSQTLEGQTDADGLVRLWADNLKGPVEISILKPSYCLETIKGVNASNITIPIADAQSSNTEETITLSGTVTGLEALPIADPENLEFNVVRIGFGLSMNELINLKKDGFFPEANTVEIRMDSSNPDFSITVPKKPGILYASAGIVDIVTEEDLPINYLYNWTLLGKVPLDPTQNSQSEGIILPLEIPLDETLTREFTTAPSMFNTKTLQLGLDYGDEGTIWFLKEEYKNGQTKHKFKVPLSLENEAPIIVATGAKFVDSSNDTPIDATDHYPRGYALNRQYETFEDIPNKVAGVATPFWNCTFQEDLFDCLPPLTSLYRIWFYDTQNKKPYWRLTDFETFDAALELPTIPAHWNWEGIPQTEITIKAMGANTITPIKAFDYEEFGKNTQKYSLNTLQIE